jgi:hypothetical protein
MENLIVSASNLYALYPLYLSIRSRKFINVILLAGSMTSSILYHLSEHSKHNLKGITYLNNYERSLLNSDRFFAIVTISYYIYKYPRLLFEKKKYILFALLCLAISEFPLIRNHVPKPIYIISHSLWHILAFHIAVLKE